MILGCKNVSALSKNKDDSIELNFKPINGTYRYMKYEMRTTNCTQMAMISTMVDTQLLSRKIEF